MGKFIERIASDSRVCSGKPCIKGTRIPVHMILDLLATGESFEGIRKAYPNITDKDIRACLAYASILADEEAGSTA
ncbi:MAG: antitoxin [Nitrospirae bacterium CG08_land_8_20_14_0_20_52_24]|nr:MAG: antitoxin [Nitrospirae bacterium CG08_land_8_20_14_0_20_52_24]PIV84858.1 MAG: antitoxin [Nitrospirae bacterium CG17_big_fil_post_rev_8_21_14_2_50_50_9]PIX86956.1 MAG: antitoxin [Nitrospirae bacterium CG_4_10_14_3_um_filter_53_41]